jgi:MFS family permease
LTGYNQGVFSGVLVMNSFKDHMGNYDTDRPEDQSRKGWLTSILELGAWLGCLLSGFMAEVFSRKRGILFATGVFILGVVIQV